MRKILIPNHRTITTAFAALRTSSLVGGVAMVIFSCGPLMAQQPGHEQMALQNPGSIEEFQGFPEIPSVIDAPSALDSRTEVRFAGHDRLIGTENGLRRQALGARGSRSNVPSPCSAGCDVSWYLNAEALWLTREGDDRFSLMRNSLLPEFEYELGGRFTIGTLSDCVNAWEAVYAGPFDWDRRVALAGPANLQSNLAAVGGFTSADIDAFNGADSQIQVYEAELHSFELNRRWWSWDVLSTMIGVRYIDYEEVLAFSSVHGTNGTGLLFETIDNQMVGAQVGGDIYFPVSLRGNIGLRGKAGVFANFNERSTFLSNGGTLLVNTGDSGVDLAGLAEFGVFANYHIVPSVRLVAGYEVWCLPGIATITEQSPSRVSPGMGTSIENGANLFLHGGSVGLQVLF